MGASISVNCGSRGPASVLAALVLPAVIFPERHAAFDWSNPQIPAAIVAGLVAWKTRSTLLTLAVGMGVLLALKYWGWRGRCTADRGMFANYCALAQRLEHYLNRS